MNKECECRLCSAQNAALFTTVSRSRKQRERGKCVFIEIKFIFVFDLFQTKLSLHIYDLKANLQNTNFNYVINKNLNIIISIKHNRDLYESFPDWKIQSVQWLERDVN